jgi:Fe-S oxidoreductase
MEACPVFVEHVQKIVDMRRYLALTEMSFPDGADTMMRSLENNFNPYGKGYTARADWAEGHGVPTLADNKDAEYLFFVGCAGAFDPRAVKTTLATVEILKTAGVSFGILGAEEQCCGDAPRRMGNEYLAQTLIEANVETFKKHGVKKIITNCPHGYNILKKEYADYGGVYEVFHTSEIILGLIKTGKIKLTGELNEKIAFHDSCYLGRYNNMYAGPRELVTSVRGAQLVEMARSHKKSFCCGGGGGWNFLEETEGKRINVERTEQALATGCDAIAVACPFCTAMFEDGLKAKDADEKVKVRDLAEIIAAVMEKHR